MVTEVDGGGGCGGDSSSSRRIRVSLIYDIISYEYVVIVHDKYSHTVVTWLPWNVWLRTYLFELIEKVLNSQSFYSKPLAEMGQFCHACSHPFLAYMEIAK